MQRGHDTCEPQMRSKADIDLALGRSYHRQHRHSIEVDAALLW
jgi:hypothetical protein